MNVYAPQPEAAQAEQRRLPVHERSIVSATSTVDTTPDALPRTTEAGVIYTSPALRVAGWTLVGAFMAIDVHDDSGDPLVDGSLTLACQLQGSRDSGWCSLAEARLGFGQIRRWQGRVALPYVAAADFLGDYVRVQLFAVVLPFQERAFTTTPRWLTFDVEGMIAAGYRY